LQQQQQQQQQHERLHRSNEQQQEQQQEQQPEQQQFSSSVSNDSTSLSTSISSPYGTPRTPPRTAAAAVAFTLTGPPDSRSLSSIATIATPRAARATGTPLRRNNFLATSIEFDAYDLRRVGSVSSPDMSSTPPQMMLKKNNSFSLSSLSGSVFSLRSSTATSLQFSNNSNGSNDDDLTLSNQLAPEPSPQSDADNSAPPSPTLLTTSSSSNTPPVIEGPYRYPFVPPSTPRFLINEEQLDRFSRTKKNDDFRQQIWRYGVPPEMRWQLWPVIAGVKAKKAATATTEPRTISYEEACKLIDDPKDIVLEYAPLIEIVSNER
jgi:hypothetical protein